MNEPSEEKLISFLKEHQPSPPPASMELERSLFETLANEPKATVAPITKRKNILPFDNWKLALVACGLLIGMGVGLNNYNLSQKEVLEAEILDQTDISSLYAIDPDTGLYDVSL
jgi:hypothetical protein